MDVLVLPPLPPMEPEWGRAIGSPLAPCLDFLQAHNRRGSGLQAPREWIFIQSHIDDFSLSPYPGHSSLSLSLSVCAHTHTHPCMTRQACFINCPFLFRDIGRHCWLGRECSIPVALGGDHQVLALSRLCWVVGPSSPAAALLGIIGVVGSGRGLRCPGAHQQGIPDNCRDATKGVASRQKGRIIIVRRAALIPMVVSGSLE